MGGRHTGMPPPRTSHSTSASCYTALEEVAARKDETKASSPVRFFLDTAIWQITILTDSGIDLTIAIRSPPQISCYFRERSRTLAAPHEGV